MSLGLTPVAQAIASAIILIGVLVLYLYRFAGSKRWALVAGGVCLLDQCVKHLALRGCYDRHISLLNGSVQVVYLRNYEQGFGGSVSSLLLLTLLCVLMLILLYDLLARAGYRMSVLTEFGFALLMGGCIGILLERLVLGHVVDFLVFGRGGEFVYNLADLAAVVALGLLALRAARYLTEPRNWRASVLDGAL